MGTLLTRNIIRTQVHARMTGKLLLLCNFNLHHSICTTLLYKILFTKSKNIYLFSFYSTKCPGRFDLKNARSLISVCLTDRGSSWLWQKFSVWRSILYRVFYFLPCCTFFTIKYKQGGLLKFRKKYFVQKRCTNWMM